ncbi:MAG TPA: ribonuclease HII [Actinocrinis sp.]|nr:ribonuclease HII [Actinocrinis sp.]
MSASQGPAPHAQGQLDVGIPSPPALGGGQDLYAYEAALREAGYPLVAGADEAGRGACAGPLTAAAVILPEGVRIPGLNDSKLLTEATRERLYGQVVEHALAWAAWVIPAAEVDRVGVQEANYTALRQSMARLDPRPVLALFDGFTVPRVATPSHAVVKGDRLVACIAAASVIAKVTHDRIMLELHEQYPEYDFPTHKGYATAVHQAALDRHGGCPEHRFSYANVRKLSLADAKGPFVGENGSRSAPGAGVVTQGDLLDFADQRTRGAQE